MRSLLLCVLCSGTVAGSERWGENFVGGWTQSRIFGVSLCASSASSLFLFCFCYDDIICMLFIIQVDLCSSFVVFLIGTIINFLGRRRREIRRH